MRYLAAILVVALAMGFALPVPACGPEVWSPAYATDNGIDTPLSRFVDGHLGVLHARSSRRDQIAAYRILSGLSIALAEQAAMTREPQEGVAPDLERWLNLSGQAYPGGDGGAGETYSVGGNGVYSAGPMSQGFWDLYLNCPDDAFRVAAATFEKRKTRYSNQPELLQEWLTAQEAVFDNCTGSRLVPKPLPGDRPLLAREDRTYQIAAAQFYSGQYPQAAQSFAAIAADSASPWHTGARYLAARAMVREATLDTGPASAPDISDPAATEADAGKAQTQRLYWLAHAEAQVDAVLRDPGERAWWHAAEGLRGFIEVRLHPQERMRELARRLMAPDDAQFAQDSQDLVYLYEHGNESARKGNDLVEWLYLFPIGAGDREWAYESDVAHWQAGHGLPWLVAAIMAAHRPLGKYIQASDWPHLDELLAAAAKVPASSPAFLTLRFETMRIAADRQQPTEAYQAAAATNFDGMAIATRNEFLAARFLSAPTLAAALAAAPRTSLDGSFVGFDSDSLAYFNDQAGLGALAKAATMPGVLPQQMQHEVLVAAWTRAALVDNVKTAAQLSAKLAAYLPATASYLAAYAAAASPQARRFEVAWMLLHFPGLSPYVGGRVDYGGTYDIPVDRLVENGGFNWWSPTPPSSQEEWWESSDNQGLEELYSGDPSPRMPFATREDRNNGELEQLQSLGMPTDLLCRWVLEWVSVHPDDPRAAPALALAVNAAGHHEGDAQTAELSQACFDLLHARFAGTSWAKRTPRPYKGICGKWGDACP